MAFSEQTGNDITFYIQMLNTNGGALTGITVNIAYWRFNKQSEQAVQFLNGFTVQELGSSGVYYSTLDATLVTVEGDYVAIFTTTNTSALYKSIPVICQVGRGVALLGTRSLTELPGVPPASPKFEQALMLGYMALRNKLETTSSALKLHNAAGTEIAQASIVEDTTKFTRNGLT